MMISRWGTFGFQKLQCIYWMHQLSERLDFVKFSLFNFMASHATLHQENEEKSEKKLVNLCTEVILSIFIINRFNLFHRETHNIFCSVLCDYFVFSNEQSNNVQHWNYFNGYLSISISNQLNQILCVCIYFTLYFFMYRRIITTFW